MGCGAISASLTGRIVETQRVPRSSLVGAPQVASRTCRQRPTDAPRGARRVPVLGGSACQGAQSATGAPRRLTHTMR